MTLKNIYDLLNELSDTNNHISEHLSWQESHEDFGMTANLPETNDADKEEQRSDDENDLLVRFSSLGRSLKTFQCDLTTADQRVESIKKVSYKKNHFFRAFFHYFFHHVVPYILTSISCYVILFGHF